jgi:hypothetical protein
MERLIGKPREQPSQEDKPWPPWQLSFSCVPYLNGIHGILHKNRFEIEGENFLLGKWWKFTDGCIAIPESLTPTFVTQLMKALTQGTQLSRPPWPTIFMSPSSPASVRQYMKGSVCVPETIPDICWCSSTPSQDG